MHTFHLIFHVLVSERNWPLAAYPLAQTKCKKKKNIERAHIIYSSFLGNLILIIHFVREPPQAKHIGIIIIVLLHSKSSHSWYSAGKKFVLNGEFDFPFLAYIKFQTSRFVPCCLDFSITPSCKFQTLRVQTSRNCDMCVFLRGILYAFLMRFATCNDLT